MGAKFIETDQDDGVFTLRIQRTERRNALHGPLWDEIRATAEAIAGEAPRAVLLTGAGGHFSAGMDLKPDNPILNELMAGLQEDDEARLRALIEGLKASLEAVRNLPCPVVAAIEGACTGGGLELALACDIRVAAEDAFFSLPETQLGLMPDVGGTIRIKSLIGAARAAHFILSGERVDAETAAHWGLVQAVTPKGGAEDAARAMIATLQRSAPRASHEVLRLLRNPAASLADETDAGVRVLQGKEVFEGVAAFLEKRAPKWRS